MENKKWENIKKIRNFESLKKCEIENMKKCGKDNRNKRENIVRGDKCKNPKGYTME